VVISIESNTKPLNGKNIISKVLGKAQSLRNTIANIFAPREEFALAIA